LESELATLKLRVERANVQSQKTASLEDALSAKADELNDIRRKTLAYEKQIGVLEAELRQTRNEFDSLKRENVGLKSKLLENGQDIRRTY
jgi:peptidoglycan hydrolase CwlO-like protein